MTPQDRLPGNYGRTADSPEGQVCGSMEEAGPWATPEAREAGRNRRRNIASVVASFEGVITLEGPGTHDA